MPINTAFLQEAAEIDSCRAPTATSEISELAKMLQTAPHSPVPARGSVHLHAHPYSLAQPGAAAALLDPSWLMCTQLRCPSITSQVRPGSRVLKPRPESMSLANVTGLLSELWLTSPLWMCVLPGH